MGTQHPSPNVKFFCKFEPQIWLEIITSRDAKSACFKGSRTSCRETIFGIFWPNFGQKRSHHVMDASCRLNDSKTSTNAVLLISKSDFCRVGCNPGGASQESPGPFGLRLRKSLQRVSRGPPAPESKKCPKQSRNSLRSLKIDCFWDSGGPEGPGRLFGDSFGILGPEGPLKDSCKVPPGSLKGRMWRFCHFIVVLGSAVPGSLGSSPAFMEHDCTWHFPSFLHISRLDVRRNRRVHTDATQRAIYICCKVKNWSKISLFIS